MKIYFPEYKDAFGKIDGAFSLELLKAAPFPDELAAIGTEGMKQIWHQAKLRGRGYANASSILEYARKSVGIKDGAYARRFHMQRTFWQYQESVITSCLEYLQRWGTYQDLTM